MRLTIKTSVNQSAKEVWDGFTKDLFLALSPPFPKVRLLRFDGSTKGDMVGLELDFVFFKQKWISHITENGEDDKEIYFIDQGQELPFFLKQWSHHHRILKQDKGAIIVDDIKFSTGSILGDLLLWPGMFFQFLYRKPIYKKFFR